MSAGPLNYILFVVLMLATPGVSASCHEVADSACDAPVLSNFGHGKAASDESFEDILEQAEQADEELDSMRMTLLQDEIAYTKVRNGSLVHVRGGREGLTQAREANFDDTDLGLPVISDQ
mmetsp:Transcript_15034/g.33093  ORF Transcript_15034/g.33093 Transcript_15034/m.33093 type:complete len:120 (-) Transcript_15034:124-483(-)|eukprot:CAMPEP_0170612896 /NCGR_PEP_ID=MMETSP0224-20130122/23974_1 /TAXON_ID=285029 /ORGANISM="Togula jolla, Strain CCCM 725" /LENGTH=119 /DNA_ID=CAMNT_0010938443 /DNA_START=70 /DNA_END=429 /DNA_ORIENTATION=+